MNKHLRTYVREQRELKGIRLGPLSETIGYKNRNKGATIILKFEREGIASDDLLQKLVVALQIDQEGMIEAMQRDRAEWEKWVNEPVPMQMIVRFVAAVYSPHRLPSEIITPDDAVQYARNFAKERGFRVCLALNRRESVWIREDGGIIGKTYAQPGIPNIPYTTVGGRRKFLFGTTERGFHPVVIREP